MTHRINWDDLRFILAVAEEGTLAAAARSLGVNHTTVLRRINTFETANGIRLFQRLPTGYQLTAEGQEVVETGHSIDALVLQIERRITGTDLRLEGTLRITTTDALLTKLINRHIPKFKQRHPNIKLDLSITNSMLNLTGRDADVAIRPSLKPPDALVGKRISGLAFCIYGTPDQISRAKNRSYSDCAWLGVSESVASAPVGHWLDANVPERAIELKADTFLPLLDACENGLGIAALPCFLGDQSRHLVRLAAPIKKMENALWILTHEDLRRTARVRAFVKFISGSLREERALLEGRSV
ncbi:MAG: LysR family transcriptional regulator [Stappiaceae bacterium]